MTAQDQIYADALRACPKGEGWRVRAKKPAGYHERQTVRLVELLYAATWQFGWATPDRWLTDHLTVVMGD